MLFAILILLLLLTFIVILVRDRLANWRIREAQCARCAYPIRGLPGDTCPECGANLRETGAVVSPGAAVRGSLAADLVGWSFAMALFSLLAVAMGSEVLPRCSKWRQQWHLRMNGHPEFGYTAIDIRASDEQWKHADVRPRRVTVTLVRPSGTSPMLLVDLGVMTMGQGAPLTTAFNQVSLREWLSSNGATGTPGQLDYQARAVHAAITTLDPTALVRIAPHDDWTQLAYGGRRLALLAGSGGSSGGPALSERKARHLVGAFMLALWLAGCFWLARRRRLHLQ